MPRPFGKGHYSSPNPERINVDIFSRSMDTLKASQESQERDLARRRNAHNKEAQERAAKRVKTTDPPPKPSQPAFVLSRAFPAPSPPTRYFSSPLPMHHRSSDPTPPSPLSDKRSTRTEPNVISLSSDDDDGEEDKVDPTPSKGADPLGKGSVGPIRRSTEEPTKAAAALGNSNASGSSTGARRGEAIAIDSDSEEEEEWIKKLKARVRENKSNAAPHPTSGSAASQTPVQAPASSQTPIGESTTRQPQERALYPNDPHPEPPGAGTQNKDDPVISLVVHSRTITETSTLVIYRRVGQPLRPVREAWCKRWGLTPEETAKTFLTWRGTRIFDSATCHVLGLRVDSEGDAYYIHERRHQADYGFKDGKVELEIYTQELFDKYKADCKAKHDTVHGTEKDPDAMKEAPSIKVTLKARGREDYRLRVRGSTTVDEMLLAWRRQANLTHERIFMKFEGERLPEDTTAAEADMTEQVTVEVHFEK